MAINIFNVLLNVNINLFKRKRQMARNMLTLLWIILIITTSTNAIPNVMTDYCEYSTFNATCPPNEVVVMSSALYGRMQVSKCTSQVYGGLGCSVDILHVIDRLCSGRRSCSVKVRDLMISEKTSCSVELRSYLKAQYTCIPIASAVSCCHSSTHINLHSRSGFIGNVHTEESHCGTIECPWRIQAGRGQTINLTLYDFRSVGTYRKERYRTSAPVCQVYVIIKDLSRMTAPDTVCGGEGVRIQSLQTFHSTSIEIRVVNKNRDREASKAAYFLIKYEVDGCADPLVPRHGWMRRVGPEVVAGCDVDLEKQIWRMTCKNDEWIGELGNCTIYPYASSGLFENMLTMSPNLSVVIVALIALIISIIILSIGIVYLRRRWLKNNAPRSYYTDTNGISVNPSYGSPRNTHHLLVTSESCRKGTVTSCVSNEVNGPSYYPMPPRYLAGNCVKVPLPSIPPTSERNVPVDLSPADAKSYDPQDDRYADHVYESPNFERRSQPGDVQRFKDVDTQSYTPGVQYFELEPEEEAACAASRMSSTPQPASRDTDVVRRKSNLNNNLNTSQDSKNVPIIPPHKTHPDIIAPQRCSFPGTNVPPLSTTSGHQTQIAGHIVGSMTS